MVELLTEFREKESRRTMKISEGEGEGFRGNMKGGNAESNRLDAILKREGEDSQIMEEGSKECYRESKQAKEALQCLLCLHGGVRMQYKQKHSNNKSIAAVGKAGGVK